MGVPCLVEIDGTAYKPRKPYVFACLPRIGETVSLEWDGEEYPRFIVYRIVRVPDEVQEQPAFTVLFVRKE